ncbi:unnamed protein product [Blepharisma stoltei]|uniref:Kinesin motor domain-containing protein n=1 Tax=Blepharisma stoltei TaxID=1481888 RepID=A0AAU9IQ72_9CILI|nr:unnamed protein product [Blepharisma stoltei]
MSDQEADIYLQLDQLKQEYEDYQAQSKEYEELLESEVAEKDEKLSQAVNKIEKLTEELQNYKERYQKNESEVCKLQKEIDQLRSRLKIFEEQKRELEHLNDQWENSARILEYSKQDLEERLYQAEENAIMYKGELDEITYAKEVEIQRLKEECNELRQEIATLATQKGDTTRLAELEQMLSNTLKEQEELKSQLDTSRQTKKSGSHISSRRNSIDSSTNSPAEACHSVKVLVKVRPVLDSDTNKSTCVAYDELGIQVSTFLNKEKGKPITEIKKFEFDRIFGSESSIDDLFFDIAPSINMVASGGRACILAYGQTGSGKTYTMNEVLSKSVEALKVAIVGEYQVYLNCIEIYNEQVRNLLSNDALSKNWKETVEMAEIKLENDWFSQCLTLIQQAALKRSTKFTESNSSSSRSHCIYTLKIVKGSHTGIIQFVDLAGSERISKSKVSGDILKETLLINKSLSALQDVIAALETKQNHIPYRNSMLTRILQQTLGGEESMVTVILNCNPCEESSGETVCTLALGTRLKSVDLGYSIRKNLKNEEVERTLRLLEKERADKNTILRKLDKLERDIESYQYAIKDRDSKIGGLIIKMKNKEKQLTEENEKYRKELVLLKNFQDEANKKLRIIKSHAENEAQAKNKALQQLKVKDVNIKRVLSASPLALRRPPTKYQPIQTANQSTPSRIPRPKFRESSAESYSKNGTNHYNFAL